MGNIRKRGKNTWTVQWDEPRGPDGKRRQRSKAIRGSKREAEEALASIELQIRTGMYVEPSKMTVAEYFEKWLAQARVTPKTKQEYEGIIRNHIIPALGTLLLQRLTPMQVSTYYTEKLQSGRLDGKGGLSPQTVLHHHTLVHKALGQAVCWQYLARNPSDAVDPPTVDQAEIVVLDEEECFVLIGKARETPIFIPVIIALNTGMRRGEIIGLTWRSIDLDRGSISVQRSIEQTRAGLRVKPTKTHRSRRPIRMPDTLTRIIRKYKAEMMLKAGPSFRKTDYVCLRDDGSLWPPDVLSHRFGDLIRGLDITRIRFHDLRHTFATIALKKGIHPKIVSEMLGHSSVNITLNIYSHVLPHMQEDAAAQIDDVLRGAINWKTS